MTVKNTTAAKKISQPSKVAVYSSGNIFHPIHGRISKGYNILDPETAKTWMEISDKIREATPEEVASAYGV